jgi:hypothetical protein
MSLALDQLTIGALQRRDRPRRGPPVRDEDHRSPELEHADAFPTTSSRGLKELGIFGFTIPRSTAAPAST